MYTGAFALIGVVVVGAVLLCNEPHNESSFKIRTSQYATHFVATSCLTFYNERFFMYKTRQTQSCGDGG